MLPQFCDSCQQTACSILHDDLLVNCSPERCDICMQRAKNDEEITRIQNRLVELANDRLQIKQRLNGRHDLLTCRLPVELVSRIFIFTVQSSNVPRIAKTGQPPPLWNPSILLSAVSTRWRSISLSTPQLWSSITIRLNHRHPNVDIITEMLRRSQALPLSIKFDKSVSNEGRKEEYKNVLKVIHLHCNRWRSVELADLTFDFGILSGLEEAHPLDCLRLISVQNYRVRDTFPSPNPKYLVPTTLYMNDSSLIIPLIRLDDLTHLEVASVPTDQVLQVISDAPRITHFTQHAALSFPVDSLPPTPIVNNTITHAKIRSGFNVSFNLLEYLALPQLKYFYYDIGPSSNHLLRPLLAFLRRSRAHLDDFAFNFTVISRNQSTQLDNRFHKLSQITRIKLKVSPRPNRRLGPLLDKFLGALDNRNSDSYFPNLRELEIIVPPMLMSPVSWSKFSCIFPSSAAGLSSHSHQNRHVRPLTFVKIVETIDFKRYDSWEVGSDQEYAEENINVEDTESDDTSDEENVHDICGFKGGIIMDRTTYDLIVRARESGISVDLINSDGSDILDNVARLGFGEVDNKNDPSAEHSAC